ncbi:hypothetical protein ACA910_012735 [Epithemia clementina (nom. ined.)]
MPPTTREKRVTKVKTTQRLKFTQKTLIKLKLIEAPMERGKLRAAYPTPFTNNNSTAYPTPSTNNNSFV